MAFLFPLFRSILISVLASVVGGASLLYLQAQGVNLPQIIATIFEQLLQPQYYWALIIGGIGAVAVVAYLARRFLLLYFRPSKAITLQLRIALSGVCENSLSVVPQEPEASDSLNNLRLCLQNFQSYKYLGLKIARVVELSDNYMIRTTPGYRGDSERDAVERPLLVDEALALINELFLLTAWATAGSD